MPKLDWFSIDIIKKYNQDFDPEDLPREEEYQPTLSDHYIEMMPMIAEASLMEVMEFVNTLLTDKINSENAKNL